jgi:hypothetical protein
MTDPQAWQLNAPDGNFRGYVGPFSALKLLIDDPDPRVTVGPHEHCAAPPAPVPTELASAKQLSFTPVYENIHSCLEWWSVDLFVDSSGRIVAVTLDLWEP